MEVEFVPQDSSNRNIKDRLMNSLDDTKILRGAVAFWTIKKDYFDSALINALSHKDSFFIIDVSLPTNFDAILEIHKSLGTKPKFYVHTKRYEPAKGIRENLLHSKIIVMDKEECKERKKCYEIWVGSHNFTENALNGINIESSTVMKFQADENNHPVKNHITNFLNDIKNSKNVIPFDEESYYLFKALQDAAQTSWIKKYLAEHLEIPSLDKEIEFCKTIEIQGDDLDNLQGTTIIILGEETKELSDIEGSGTKVIIHADNNDGTQTFYRGTLRSRDKIDTLYSKDVQFGERRIGKKKSRNDDVILEGKGIVKKEDLEAKGFYVNIQINEKIPANKKMFVYSHPNLKKLWREEGTGTGIYLSPSLEVFQEAFLPELLYELVPIGRSDKIKNQRFNSLLEGTKQMNNFYFTQNRSIEMADLRLESIGDVPDFDYIPLFERRIYILLALNFQTKQK